MLPAFGHATAELGTAGTVTSKSAEENPDQHGMGATLTAVWIHGARLSIAHVGDSRLYQLIVEDGVLAATLATKDDSWINAVVDAGLMTLEEAHWRLSTMVGWAIGIRDRGFLREGMPADIVVYDLEKLAVKPMETVHDLPDGDWRRVQKANGYRYTIVNGEVTFEDGVCSGALPGKLLRSYDQVPG